MKLKFLVVSLLAVILVFLAGHAAGQHTEHASSQAKQKAESKVEPAMPGGMMAHHKEMQKLVGQLLESANALEAGKDPAAFKRKLDEHRALIQQLQDKMNDCSAMTQQMDEHMKSCPMMGSKHKHE